MSKVRTEDLAIAKFGGTSVADFEAMTRCVSIIKQRHSSCIVVSSAPAGITNHLVELGTGLLGNEAIREVLAHIRKTTDNILERLSAVKVVQSDVEQLLQDIEQLAYHDKLAESPALKDELLSFGERLATVMLTAIFQENDVNAVEFDVRDVLTTDDTFGAANPELDALESHCSEKLVTLVKEHIVVTQGFIGKTPWGDTTTLGRGGSDYTAALLAEALGAKICEIWTDVAGVYSTDPRIVSDAYALPELSYDEAAEMANFGAKVLHPATLAPTLRQDIPVFVGSTKTPEAGGTTIVRDCQQEPTFRAISRRRGQQLITLHTPKMERSTQFIGRVFHILDEHGLSIDLITTSETYISLTFDNYEGNGQTQRSLKALEALRAICIVDVSPELDLITVVGNNLDAKSGGAGRVFEVLDNIKVRMICYGANPHNISFLVENTTSTAVIQKLHKHLLISNKKQP